MAIASPGAHISRQWAEFESPLDKKFGPNKCINELDDSGGRKKKSYEMWDKRGKLVLCYTEEDCNDSSTDVPTSAMTSPETTSSSSSTSCVPSQESNTTHTSVANKKYFDSIKEPAENKTTGNDLIEDAEMIAILDHDAQFSYEKSKSAVTRDEKNEIKNYQNVGNFGSVERPYDHPLFKNTTSRTMINQQHPNDYYYYLCSTFHHSDLQIPRVVDSVSKGSTTGATSLINHDYVGGGEHHVNNEHYCTTESLSPSWEKAHTPSRGVTCVGGDYSYDQMKNENNSIDPLEWRSQIDMTSNKRQHNENYALGFSNEWTETLNSVGGDYSYDQMKNENNSIDPLLEEWLFTTE